MRSRLRHGLELGVAIAALFACCAVSVTEAQSAPLHGVRFRIDTLETSARARSPLVLFVGVVELADGHGRIDVVAVRSSPTIAVNGKTVGPPLARTGDYYLFDTTGFTLVRPTARTFTRFSFTRATVRHGRGVFPGEQMIRQTVQRFDTVKASSTLGSHSRGAFTLRSHLDRWYGDGRFDQLARSWIEVRDAPLGEGSVVRWFGAAQELATMPAGLVGISLDSLRVTALLLVGPIDDGHPQVQLTTGLRIYDVRTTDIAASRLALPKGFREASWTSR
ncbi:MAG TPA: hypothetical protein VGM82_23375 [Gemmatimonadaceae bacterium]|jgi:hypothetical protein